jgi:acyl-CoA synthetase (AMP-forming)/AMP-acid ligase II
MWHSMVEVFDKACVYYANRPAVATDDGDRLTYAEIDGWADRVAGGLLDLGIEREQAVGILMPNCLAFIPTWFGTWRSGAAIVQMQARAGVADFRYFLASSEARLLIYAAEFDDVVAELADELPDLEHLIRLGGNDSAPPLRRARSYDEVFGTPRRGPLPQGLVDPDARAYLCFTSGSTGSPKGVVHSHRTWANLQLAGALEFADIRDGEVFAHVAPMTHFSGMFILPTLMRGGLNIVLNGFDVAKLARVVQRDSVTGTALVPTMLYMMLDQFDGKDFDLSSLRTIIYAGSPIAPERLGTALDVFGPVFVQMYGGTEIGPTSALSKTSHVTVSADETAPLSSAGRPFFHVEVSIQDQYDRPLSTGEIGEVCVRQYGMMLGYIDDTIEPAVRDGWAHSGDVGYLDGQGFLYLVDRKKDMIVSGGINVFPRLVEDVLFEHADVLDCAVIGIPDDKWGEAVTAFVVRREGASVSDRELMQLVKSRRGAAAAPKSVRFLEALPLNASGKVAKKILREPFWAGRARRVG